MKKLMSTVIIIAMLITVLTTGCSNSNNGNATKQKSGKDEKVTLTFVNWATGAEEQMYKDLISEYKKDNPNIDIKIQQVPWDGYQDKINTMVAGSAAPDIIYMSQLWFPAFASKGVLLDLSKNVNNKDFDKGDFHPVLLKAGTYDNKVYWIARDLDYVVLYYNKDMFDKANLKYPDENWTWNDLLQAAQKLTKDTNGDGKIDQYGFLSVGDYVSFPFIWQNGGKILSSDGKKAEFDNPKTIEAMQWLSDLITKYKVSPDPSTIRDQGTSTMFKNGQVAMATFGRWLAPSLKSIQNFHWGVALLPKGKVNRNSFVSGSGYTIFAGTKHPKEAWDFVNWLSSAKIQEEMAVKIGFGVPSRLSVEKKLFADSSDPNDKVFAEQTKYMTPIPTLPNLQEVLDIYNKYLDLVRLGQMSAQDAGKKINDEVNQALSEK